MAERAICPSTGDSCPARQQIIENLAYWSTQETAITTDVDAYRMARFLSVRGVAYFIARCYGIPLPGEELLSIVHQKQDRAARILAIPCIEGACEAQIVLDRELRNDAQ